MLTDFPSLSEPSDDTATSSEGIVSPTSSVYDGGATATPIIDDMGVDDDLQQTASPPSSPSMPVAEGDGGGIVAENWASVGGPNVQSAGNSQASRSICDDSSDYGPRLPPIGSMDVDDSPAGLMTNPFDIESDIGTLSDGPLQGAPGLPPLQFSSP